MTMIMLCAVAMQAREKININMGWMFLRSEAMHAEEVTYDDSGWQRINLPHDAVVGEPFYDYEHGATAISGFLPIGSGWYRKHITYDETWRGQRVMIEFEGVYRDAKVYINGQLCDGDHPNGYLDFEIDITEMLTEGDNVIAVHYDNTYAKSSRWYNGEGINRDVWLNIVNPLHVDRYGTYITTPKVTTEEARVIVETAVRNDRRDSVLCELITDIIDPEGKVVATTRAVTPMGRGEVYTFRSSATIANPQLWRVGEGKLYKAVSHVRRDSRGYGNRTYTMGLFDVECDTYVSTFGIREIVITPDDGLKVNGERVFINGVCLHTDLGPLGTASFAAAWNRRLEILTKELGCNGFRLSHNTYPKYVLDWADAHGVLIIDEFFDKWEDSYYGRGATIDSLQLHDLRTHLARDRNHPSVFLWSVGNEVYQQIRWEKTVHGGLDTLKMLVEEVHRYDPTRKVTVSQYPNRYSSITRRANRKRFLNAEPNHFEFYTDVVSTNYTEDFWDRDHEKFPQLIFVGGEVATGDLGYDYFNYSHSYPIGQFYWGGTDYIGESHGVPFKGWVRGLVDFTNRLKPIGQSVKSFYNADPMVKVISRPKEGSGSTVWNDLKMTWISLEEHWNYNEGDSLGIQVMTNCEEVEFFLNGTSLGRKQLPPADTPPELVWEVVYTAGEVRAVGYNDGVKVAEDVVRTAGTPYCLVANIDRDTIAADGLDLAYIDYVIVDSAGNVCPITDKLSFNVEGVGTIAGVASADMTSDESWVGNYRTTYGGRCQLIIRSSGRKGRIIVKANSANFTSLTSESILLAR